MENLRVERRLGDAMRARLPLWAVEFVMFGLKMAWACLFAGLLLAAIILSALFWPEGAALARYDALTLFALLVQGLMLYFRLESWREAKVILLFHVTGTAMEIFKLQMGSWSYPEAGWLMLGGVPLFSGFMYASVGSFIARAIRLFDMTFTNYPPMRWAIALAVAIYINFFAHHFVWDARYLLMLATLVLFGRVTIRFTPMRRQLRLPMVLSAAFAAFFLYVAENIGTLSGTWMYSGDGKFAFTDPAKMGSWYLLLFVSFVQVTLVCRAALLPQKD
ncbi:DUF817 domain-containing protein [Abyssibius alkaniclasticus]|uniref:DUF817 domain-containing protein n=1 Tax=Abyssibius alkaniclasticus TaxID=2881234 RepID=UPI002363C96B|nr:DUF817 domain-containing protein [Abyssibius alkaniclasticus]UPH72174.1 DUF817 domain-containing protein [Abyssibius alkaniclasticus]